MKPTRSIATALALVALVAGGMVSVRAGGQNPQDDPFEKLKSYDFQTRAPVAAIYTMIQQNLADKAQTAKIEDHLVAVLDDPNATFAGKQEACRMLWIIGTARSVPSLAKMLSDEKLADPARYALERNADPSAAKALRDALGTAQGKTQIGLINSLGDRGDAEAVPLLKPLATSTDPLVSEATIVALGKIGTESALSVLRTLPASSPIVGHAMVRCAAHLAATGKKSLAMHTFEGLAGEGRPNTVRAEAVERLAGLQSPRASTVAIAALKSSDPYLQEVAARVCGTLTDKSTTTRSIVIWPTLPVPTQTVLLAALADRREPAATPIALAAMQSQDATLRLTGIRAAARIGGAKAVTRLADIAVHGEGSDRGEARQGLAIMPGAEAEQAILELAKQGPPDTRATLMGVLADRPSPAAMATLLEAAQGADSRVAVEALRALGRVGGATEQAALVKLLVTTSNDDVRDADKDAVVSIGQRLGDRDRAAEPVLAALPGAPAAGHAALLVVLAQTGGDRALEALTRATGDSDPQVKQAAITALADNWSDSRALPTLLTIARSDSDKAVRVQALRGYLRLVGQDDRMSAEDKVANVSQALSVAERPEEKRQALSVLRECRVTPAMDLAAKLLDDPQLFPEAADTVLYLAGRQRRGNQNLRAVTGPSTTAALDKIIQTTKDDGQRAEAQRLKG